MITILRHFFVDSWLGRILALLVFLAFMGLGGTFVGLGGGGLDAFTENGIIKVGHYNVTRQELYHGIQSQESFMLQNGLSPVALQDPEVQQKAVHEALRNLIIAREAALAAERGGIVLSDELIRQRVFSVPEFLDSKGQFDAAKMDALLQRNHLDHAFLIDHTRRQLFSEAVLLDFGKSAKVPSSLIDYWVHFYTRTRVTDVFHMPFTAGNVPEQASDAKLHRFYDNHPGFFREPEFRHAHIVAMTPQSVSSTIDVPDDVLRGLYKMRERDYNLPETRSVQVLGFEDEAKAQQAARAWNGITSWENLKKQFPEAIPAELTDARKSDLPDEAMADAAFKAVSGQVVGPVKTAAGWSVVHVVTVTPPHRISFEQARDAMREEVQKSESVAVLHSRLKSFQDAVAGSTSLDKIPDNIGVVPAAGTLDAQGMTQSGEPAPVPGDQTMRQAIVRQVFAQDKDALPHVVTMPDGSAFAVMVDDVHPGRQKSFDEAHVQVLLAWQMEQKKRDANIRVTDLYQAAKAGTFRETAARHHETAGLQTDIPFSLLHRRRDIPEMVAHSIFRMAVGQSAMLEADGAFWIISVTAEHDAAAEDVQSLRQRLMQQQTQALQDDMLESLGMAYMREVMPRHFNPVIFNQTREAAFPQGVAAQGGK